MIKVYTSEPCPFCGFTNIFYKYIPLVDDFGAVRDSRHRLTCMGCFVCMEGDSKTDVYQAWNSRQARAAQANAVADEKLQNIMLAHLDGIYKFSARDNCDELVTQLIRLVLRPAIPDREAMEQVSKALKDARSFMDSCHWEDDDTEEPLDPLSRIKTRIDQAIDTLNNLLKDKPHV